METLRCIWCNEEGVDCLMSPQSDIFQNYAKKPAHLKCLPALVTKLDSKHTPDFDGSELKARITDTRDFADDYPDMLTLEYVPKPLKTEAEVEAVEPTES